MIDLFLSNRQIFCLGKFYGLIIEYNSAIRSNIQSEINKDVSTKEQSSKPASDLGNAPLIV